MDFFAWIKTVPYFKTGSLSGTLQVIAAAISFAVGAPPEVWVSWLTSGIGTLLLKFINPADNKTTLAGKE